MKTYLYPCCRALLRKGALAALCVALFAVFAPTVSRADQCRFVLENHTGFHIVKVYYSSPGDNKWHLMSGQCNLLDGDQAAVTLNGLNVRYLDLRVEYADGSYYEWYHLNTDPISRLMLYFLNGQLIARWV